MFVRPVTQADHDAIHALARQAGFGMTSLPPDADVLQEKIARSLSSFAGVPERPGGETFLFVLEDPETGEIAGTAGIVAHVGLTHPFYSYKLSTLTHFCQSLDIHTRQKVLHVVNDYTGVSEIGSLFLAPEYRRDRIGRLLSRMRFLFIAEFRSLFDERIISEIRGIHDTSGNSPFYSAIAEPFFQMTFREADYTNATKGNQFIADLMPKYPVYVNLLPKEGQDVLGKPFPASEAAMAMLAREGFRYNGYLDVFDGGPTMEAAIDEVRTVRESRHGIVGRLAPVPTGERALIASGGIPDFRAAMDRLDVHPDGNLTLPPEAATILRVEIGDTVRYMRGV